MMRVAEAVEELRSREASLREAQSEVDCLTNLVDVCRCALADAVRASDAWTNDMDVKRHGHYFLCARMLFNVQCDGDLWRAYPLSYTPVEG